jgi:hypothetical protein
MIDTKSLPPDFVGVMDLMKYPIYYQLVYDLGTSDWQQLTFTQQFQKHRTELPIACYLSLYHGDNMLVDQVLLQQTTPIVVSPASEISEVNPSLLTSSFITQTTEGVRHELTLPSATLIDLLGIVKVEDSIYSLIDNYFDLHNPVYSNDEKLTVELSYMQVLGGNTEKQNFIYLDLFYPTVEFDKIVKITWEDYNWKFRWFESHIIGSDSAFSHIFSRYQPEVLIKPGLIELD